MHKLKFQLENKTKLGKIAHFSTLPVKTCYQDCGYCYAKKSVRMYPTVKENYTRNTNALNNFENLPDTPKNRKVVRMYVSGDFQNKHAINEWRRLALYTPDTIFYGYTKQWKNKKLLKELEKLKSYNNVVLRASVDDKTGYNVPKGWIKAGITDSKSRGLQLENGVKSYVCKFQDDKIKCDTCRICFSKKLENIEIYFPKH